MRIAEYSVAHTLDQTIQNALDEIGAATGSSVGFFHFVDEDQKSLLLQTWSTNTLTTQCTAEGKGSHYSIDKAGVWADCVREGRPVVHNDYASLSDRKGLPKGHAPLVRGLTVPVRRGGRTMIIVGVGNKPTDYDQSDLDVVVQLAELVLDIVLVKKGQETLLESEEKLKFVFDHLVAAEFRTIPTGEVNMNDAFYKMVGYTREELKDDATRRGVSHPDDIAKTQPYFDDLLAGHIESARFEKRYLHKDGSVVWADVSTSLSRNSAGEPMYFMTSILDITQKKRASEEIRRNELLHRAVLETAVEGYWLIDQDARFLEVNQAYCKMAGYSQPELLSMEISDVEARMSAEEIAAGLREIAAVGQAWFESMHLRKDGGMFDVEVCASALPIEGAQRYVVFIRDIAERKRNEEALKSAFEREAATANELLRGAERERRRLAVELHDGLGQMLAAAKLRSQLLASECGGDTSADAFGSLVKLLDQSISTARSLTVDLSPPALSQGLLPALERLRDQLSANSHLHCDFIVDPALAVLQGEPRMLVFRATRELLNNVARHADADWARVAGRIEAGSVILCVEDNGRGFSPAAMHSAKSLEGHFGLDSLRQEVRILGGTLEVDSAPGKGTRVEIRVPGLRRADDPSGS